ncbi:SfnB family sulfur acquisition oxidoreductase, partial [Mesorhizobium sp. M8A.F.Ca.ET.059.01.1.1]
MTVSTVKTDQASAAVLPVARPSAPAHIIRDDAEAIAVAHALAAEFVKDSSK